MKTSKKIVITVVAAIVVIGGVFLARYLISLNAYQDAVRNITFTDIDIKGIPDGTYEGICDVNFISAKVSVIVKDGAITDLVLIEHKNDRGAPAEKIVDEILEKQTLDVDAVSGATNSSKVIKKAVENALRK